MTPVGPSDGIMVGSWTPLTHQFSFWRSLLLWTKTIWIKEAFNENQAKYSFLSILFPLTLFAMLPVCSRWLDDWYLLTMLIVIITVSFEVLLPSCLCLFLSPFMCFCLSCVPQIPDILLCLFSLAMEILLDMERK